MKSRQFFTTLLLTTILLTGSTSLISFNQPATASSWHRGLPKAMVGRWHMKKFQLKLTRSSRLFGQKTQYKYLGHHRYIVSTIPNGSKFAVKATAHHLTINDVLYTKK